MLTKAQSFQTDADKKAFDLEHRRKIRFNIGKYDAAVTAGMQHYAQHELARSRGAYLKAQVLEKLDTYLLEFGTPNPHRGEGQEHDHRRNPRQQVPQKPGRGIRRN
jgi:L-lactate dehydrogenase complex protein LldF